MLTIPYGLKTSISTMGIGYVCSLPFFLIFRSTAFLLHLYNFSWRFGELGGLSRIFNTYASFFWFLVIIAAVSHFYV